MLTGNEVSDRPSQCFIHRDDRRALHQMLDRRNGLRIARMQIEISVPDSVRCPAAGAHQPARAAEQMIRMTRSASAIARSLKARSASAIARSLNVWGSPNRFGCLADSTSEYRKN